MCAVPHKKSTGIRKCCFHFWIILFSFWLFYFPSKNQINLILIDRNEHKIFLRAVKFYPKKSTVSLVGCVAAFFPHNYINRCVSEVFKCLCVHCARMYFVLKYFDWWELMLHLCNFRCNFLEMNKSDSFATRKKRSFQRWKYRWIFSLSSSLSLCIWMSVYE